MNILKFFIFVISIHFGEALKHLKSIQLSGNITYDCFEIYKQPTLNHPLLKDHEIQLKPSTSISESKIRDPKKIYKMKIGCPKGTVPILRRRDNSFTDDSHLEEQHFNPLAVDRTHIAGMRSDGDGQYRGVRANMSVHQLNVGKDQASFSQIYIGTVANGQVNFIQTGWMVSPNLYGDGQTWTYAYWKGNNGMGCYNTNCPGFIQVSEDVPISEPQINLTPNSYLRFSIHQDKQTGNWWITQLRHNMPDVDVGYWPKELFNLMSDGAARAGYGGYVQADPSGQSPMMGNGKFPNGYLGNSADFSNIEILNYVYLVIRASQLGLKPLTDSICYGLVYNGFINRELGEVFMYGGPGGNSCAA